MNLPVPQFLFILILITRLCVGMCVSTDACRGQKVLGTLKLQLQVVVS